MVQDLIIRLLTALSIGLLVGLERGWREREEPDGSRASGIRTFGIVGLLGGVMAALALAFDAPYVFALAFLGFAGLFGWFHAHEAEHQGTYSVTSVVAGLSVFALGGLAVAEQIQVAAAGAAGLAAVLASREILHAALRRLTWIELRSALTLAVMTMIVLPLLPDRALDPWGGFNPREVWFFTVLIAAISFLGYIAVRVLGPKRGLLAGGILGAVVSSTAVTSSFAQMAAAGGPARPLAGASALAAAVSLARVSLVVLVLRWEVFVAIAPSVVLAALGFIGMGLILLNGSGGSGDGATLARNPFELRPLVIFGGLFAGFSTLSAILVAHYGAASLLVGSALAGSFDSDVAVLSALRLHGGAVTLDRVAQAVLVALAANAAGRLALAASLGPARFWVPLAGATLLAVALGSGAVLLPLTGG